MRSAVHLVEKSIFIKIEQILYPYKNALWALRPCKALGHTRPASMPGLSVGLPPSPRLGLCPKPLLSMMQLFNGLSEDKILLYIRAKKC